MGPFSAFIRASRYQLRTTRPDLGFGQTRSFIFFNRSNRVERLKRWVQRPTFYYEVGGLAGVGGAIYISNLETVPISGRRRFNIVSSERERKFGLQQYESLMEEFKGQILPQSHPQVRDVKRVLAKLVDGLERLEESSEIDLGDETRVLNTRNTSLDDWEVNVIQSPIANAFVIPGNKVFVFSGILPICADDVGIATVLSHEISHNLAHHAAEQMSSSGIRWLIVVVLATFGYLDYSGLIFLDLAFTKPRSRRQETEADMIGINLMALSCYDPRGAIPFWERMQRADNVSVPDFVSTHPSGNTRIQQFKGWMGGAVTKFENAGCTQTRTHLKDFTNASARWLEY